jgi:hypothetical protein
MVVCRHCSIVLRQCRCRTKEKSIVLSECNADRGPSWDGPACPTLGIHVPRPKVDGE